MAEPSTRTVARALELLAAVCDAGDLPLADAARRTELSSSTALRLLRTLEGAGFVRRDPDGTFRPGLRIMQLGAQALSSESLVSLAADPLRRLVEATGESCYLSVPHLRGARDGHGIYLAMEEGTHSVRHTSWVGRTVPLDGTAVGAVLRGEAPTDGPEAGYVVVEDAVESDVTAIAAPVRVATSAETGPEAGAIVAALSIVAPSYRMSPQRAADHGRLVAQEARGILHAAEDHTPQDHTPQIHLEERDR
ncbi:IclR family transcriptional regulator [Nesterenkonia sp. HG001]|uniref:IclR family transcriptional regulator n=1 Tax=Nesterenkonia sp. HG001 TaxID=2983207 RepID=UPI002AC3E402|nr:IclR family transcriptional regulator [Nesterenkonia sp. HG001]MDZ5079114.1 IclR family transcriptional regulator [Nesterenkonia sp. HG001]